MSHDAAASVRARLLNKAKQLGVPFDEVLRRYAIERLIFRLSRSEYRDHFVLKGAQLLRVWSESAFRPTIDLDLLGRISNDLGVLKGVGESLCRMTVEPDDGLQFDPDSVQSRLIKEDAEYQGVRLTLVAYLAGARIPVQVDIGFNDIVTPEPQIVTFPTLLDLPRPTLQGYTPESVFAEKFEAMVKLGEGNSRMKDFYDLRFLIRGGLVADKTRLVQAVRRTFQHRNTELPDELPVLLTETHPALPQKQVQWSAFVRKKRLADTPDDFGIMTAELRSFIAPLMDALRDVGAER